MDTTDKEIEFDNEGVCNHCKLFDSETSKRWFPGKSGEARLIKEIERIKQEGKNSEYDCIIGLSGGVDSSYLAMKVAEWGLRPLVVHVDAGWNSELAVNNIKKITDKYDFDLHTHVVEWSEMRDLHLSFLKSGLSNQDVPQDHAFFAALYKYAVANKITTILSGGNIATESVMPLSWHGGSAMDAINLKDVHRKNGGSRLKTYPTVGFLQYYLYFPFIRGMRTFRPLNFMDYDKSKAIFELEKELGWVSYGRKHGESRFTKVFQNDYLPRKYGYDKRKMHYASSVLSGQMTREEALALIDEPLYDDLERSRDIAFVCKKLQITVDEYEAFVSGKCGYYSDYKNWDSRHSFAKRMQSVLEKLLKKRLGKYS